MILDTVFPLMKQQNWKLFSLFIAFSVIINSSNGSPDETNMDLKKLAVANNELGLKLYHRLVKETSGNVFFSPFSLSNAFGMLFGGARGNSAKQLRSVLGYDTANLPSSSVPSAFDQYLNKVLPKNQPEHAAYALNLANELLVSKEYGLNPNYKKEVQNLFHAYIEEVDFMKNSDQIVTEVNNWVKTQTNGTIDNLLSELEPSTVLLILNAIYFNGNWENSFEKRATKPQTFYNHGSDSKAKKVPLMHQKETFPYVSMNDLQALELPYKGDNVSMIVLLPKQHDGLSSLEDSITPQKLLSIQKQMHPIDVIVTFPKFKVDFQRTLNPDFKALGAKDIFNPNSADLSGITSKNVYVSQVIHKAAIDVNEVGTEAAASTAIKLLPLSLKITREPPPAFTVDHPFMFAIIDKRNDLMLFLGRVTEL